MQNHSGKDGLLHVIVDQNPRNGDGASKPFIK